MTGDESDGGFLGLGLAAGYHDVAIDTSDKAAEALMSLKGTKYNDVFFQSRNNNGSRIFVLLNVCRKVSVQLSSCHYS